MTLINCDCKDCTNRFVGCHATCESYKNYRERLSKLKAEESKRVWIKNELNRFKSDAIEKIKRSR